MQKRLIRKLDLQKMLSNVKPHPSPDPRLEQYMTPVDVAAGMLYLAAYSNNDIIGKRILDLGCGTGRLALGAAFLGAREVVGVDIDKTAIKVAFENAKATGLQKKTQWIVADVDAVSGCFDTVLQNPPFGVQRRQADRKFLKKSLEVGETIYSFHKSVQESRDKTSRSKRGIVGIEASGSSFLRRFIEDRGGKIKSVHKMKMTIPHMFHFHTKRKHEFMVDLYVIEKTRGRQVSRSNLE
jgi:putative methylase